MRNEWAEKPKRAPFRARLQRWQAAAVLLVLTALALMAPAYAGIEFIGATTANPYQEPSPGSHTFTVTRPQDLEPGDVLVAQLAFVGGDSVHLQRAPRDWLPIADERFGDDIGQLAFYHVVQAGGPSSDNWTLRYPGGPTDERLARNVVVTVVAYRGVDAENPIADVRARSANPPFANCGIFPPYWCNVSAPSVTAGEANSHLIGLYASLGAQAFRPPNSMTRRAERGPSGAEQLAALAVDEALPQAGATGARNAQVRVGYNSYRPNVGLLLVLRSALPPEYACTVDNFGRAELGPDWMVQHSTGGFGSPRIVNGRLRLTDASPDVATAAMLRRYFPAAGNYLVIEFDHYAYGGSGESTGGDGIAVVLSDADVNPHPGGYGGSLGYAQRAGIAGFAGGWLGIGIDEYGNFSNPTEGRQGGPGRITHAVAVRGSGEGAEGYRYLAGAGSLAPPVSAAGSSAPAPGYRYRITIDMRQPGEAWLRVERDTGNGFRTVIDATEVVRAFGQADVPATLRLTLTGATGDSTNIHELDNVSICGVSEPERARVNHFQLEHSGTGLTCEASDVVVRACANPDCSDVVQEPIGVRLAPAAGWEDGAAVTLVDGVGTFRFRRPEPGAVTLGVSDSEPEARYAIDCIGGSAGSPCALQFEDAVFRFLDEEGRQRWPTQIAGKFSDEGAGAANLYLQALRTDEQTGACRGVFAAGEEVAVELASRCANPAGCLPGKRLEVRGGSGSAYLIPNPENGGHFASVPLRFEAESRAPLAVRYDDVGQLQLAVRYPLVDAEGEPTGRFMGGMSEPFVVRPFGFYLDAGDAVQVAGEAFSVSMTAVAWSPAKDDGSGHPQPTADLSTLSRLAGYGRAGTAPLPQFSHELLAPSSGAIGELRVDDPGAFSAGQAEARLAWSEVGRVGIDVEIADYLGGGAPVRGYLRDAGRFRPAAFAVSAPSLTDQSEWPGCESPGFTYMGQLFELGFTLTALNRGGERTRNYRDEFARLDPSNAAHLSIAAANVTEGEPLLPLSERLRVFEVNPNGEYWREGLLDVLSRLSLDRNDAPDGPLRDFTVGVAPIDADGVTVSSTQRDFDSTGDSSNDSVRLAASEQRYGRLRVLNTYGSERDALPLSLRLEYFDGRAFVRNIDDDCTPFSADALTVIAAASPPAVQPPLRQDDIVASGGGTVLRGLAPAEESLLLQVTADSSDGERKSGWATVVFQLEPQGLPWLAYDWSGDGTYDDNPQAEATFGIYRGPDRLLFRRELY
ncbi:hypothetical protein CAI21_03370 [Alkalilimnicola ehrlichii]|uniref:DUF6701 domain-containing protein n=1 Tax=Alkalilimnicola ehrlichii TaxID=351052 RepID=A0A3E0X127_9GAMM|nr:DUF6701 domain-containing protein [Alkalilimnicola ehrlichii]RFA31025.1 hypothetical protein CAI21_03370 [Alkalilimnicola ehrlichii]RFA38978.1 hypothetical protein CAL65_03520 [Alkalilimnicola ehrlichii]